MVPMKNNKYAGNSDEVKQDSDEGGLVFDIGNFEHLRKPRNLKTNPVVPKIFDIWANEISTECFSNQSYQELQLNKILGF